MSSRKSRRIIAHPGTFGGYALRELGSIGIGSKRAGARTVEVAKLVRQIGILDPRERGQVRRVLKDTIELLGGEKGRRFSTHDRSQLGGAFDALDLQDRDRQETPQAPEAHSALGGDQARPAAE